MSLIFLELGELLTGLSSTEDQVAAALRDGCEALTGPQADLDRLDRAVADAEGRCVEWSQQLADKDPDTRADARTHYEEWSAEVAARRAGRDEAERGYRELFAAREEQRTRLRVVQAAKQRVMYAQLNPFCDSLAQETEAYIGLRMPNLNHVLLKCDREDPEWSRAAAEFDELALRSGLRTDHLPTEAERVARALAAGMASAAATPPAPAPSMVDVIKQTEAHFENMALQARPVRSADIDDRRGVQRQPAPLPRSYMQAAPSARQLGLR